MLSVAVSVSQDSRAGVTEVGVERPNNWHEGQAQGRPGCWKRKIPPGLLFKRLLIVWSSGWADIRVGGLVGELMDVLNFILMDGEIVPPMREADGHFRDESEEKLE